MSTVAETLRRFLIALIFTDFLTCSEENCSNDLNFQRIYLSRGRERAREMQSDFPSPRSFRLKIKSSVPSSSWLIRLGLAKPKQKQRRTLKIKGKKENCAGREKVLVKFNFRVERDEKCVKISSKTLLMLVAASLAYK